MKFLCLPKLFPINAAFIFAFTQLINPVLATIHPHGSWEDLENRAVTALDSNQYWIAEPLLKQAMAKAEQFKPRDLRLAKSLSELGRFYTIRGHFEEAEAYLEEELSVREQVLGNDKYKCIPTMGSLVQFYINYSSRVKADKLTDEMLNLVEGKVDEARSGSFNPKFRKGQPLQGWAGVAAPVAIDPCLDWAITCDSVGNTYQRLRDFKRADRLFKAALDVKITIYGNNHLSLANSYDSLGTLCMEKKDYSEAASYFVDSLKITQKTLDPESHEAFNRLDKLARCYIKEGNYSKAEALYLSCKGFWRNEPSKWGDESRVTFALGCLYADEHRYAAAVPYLQRALDQARKFNGPNSIAVVPYLRKYAYAMYYLGDKSAMQQLQARASNIAGPPTPVIKVEQLQAKAVKLSDLKEEVVFKPDTEQPPISTDKDAATAGTSALSIQDKPQMERLQSTSSTKDNPQTTASTNDSQQTVNSTNNISQATSSTNDSPQTINSTNNIPQNTAITDANLSAPNDTAKVNDAVKPKTPDQ